MLNPYLIVHEGLGVVMRLKLNEEEQATLQQILKTYDHLCDCPEWPNCQDFLIFQRLNKRVQELPGRSFSHLFHGDPRKKQIKKLCENSRQEGLKQGLDAGRRPEKELQKLGVG